MLQIETIRVKCGVDKTVVDETGVNELGCYLFSRPAIIMPECFENNTKTGIFAKRLRKQRIYQHGFPGLSTSKIQS